MSWPWSHMCEKAVTQVFWKPGGGAGTWLRDLSRPGDSGGVIYSRTLISTLRGKTREVIRIVILMI